MRREWEGRLWSDLSWRQRFVVFRDEPRMVRRFLRWWIWPWLLLPGDEWWKADRDVFCRCQGWDAGRLVVEEWHGMAVAGRSLDDLPLGEWRRYDNPRDAL